MVGHIRIKLGPVRKAARVQAVDTITILPAYEEHVGKLKRVCLGPGVKDSAHWRIDVDRNLLEVDLSFVVGVDAFSDREFRGELYGPAFSPARPAENVNRKVRSHFFETAVVPIAELPVVIEKRHLTPLASIFNELRARDRCGRLKGALQVGIAESAKQAAKLVEELRAIVTFLLRPQSRFIPGVRSDRFEQDKNQEKNAQGTNRCPEHDTCLTQRGSLIKLSRQLGVIRAIGGRKLLQLLDHDAAACYIAGDAITVSQDQAEDGGHKISGATLVPADTGIKKGSQPV